MKTIIERWRHESIPYSGTFNDPCLVQKTLCHLGAWHDRLAEDLHRALRDPTSTNRVMTWS
jgi:hypothetical protein